MLQYNIFITHDNVKEGSNVFTAQKISDPQEISASHSPNRQGELEVKHTQISIVSILCYSTTIIHLL